RVAARRPRSPGSVQVSLPQELTRAGTHLLRRPGLRARGHAPARRRAQGRAGGRLPLKTARKTIRPSPATSDVASMCARDLLDDEESQRGALTGAHQLRIETDGGVRSLAEVAEVKALVLRVRVGVRVLDADQQRRSAQLAREGFHEGDRSAATDGHRLLAVAVAERLAGGPERGPVAFRVP